jgi:S1-C subfamily serine protease
MRHKFGRKLAATAAAAGMVVGGIVAGAPTAQASSPTLIGSGVVDIQVQYTSSYCQAHGQSDGQCWSYGTGVVVPNQWSSNEVVTDYHVIDGYAPGNSIEIKDPYSNYYEFGYVQRMDPADDLAVIWIYDSYNTVTGFTASPYTWTPAAITTAADNQTPHGTSVVMKGDAAGYSFLHGTAFDANYGTITNADMTPITCTRTYDGGTYQLINTIQTTAPSAPGDSGGPLININDPSDPYNYGAVVGLNEGCGSAHSYDIPIHWAIWDMLHTKP